MDTPRAEQDPLSSESPLAWERLIESLDPAAMLVRIERRMSPLLKSRMTAEDIWQESLLHAWRDRSRHRWNGARAFRSWLIEIAENRMRDAADHEGAAKRGGGVAHACIQPPNGGTSAAGGFEPISSTTPSRSVLHRERADAIHSALDSLPEGLREVVRRRLVEEQGVDEIATALGLSHTAVKHRLRKGSATYRQLLQTRLGSRDGSNTRKP